MASVLDFVCPGLPREHRCLNCGRDASSCGCLPCPVCSRVGDRACWPGHYVAKICELLVDEHIDYRVD